MTSPCSRREMQLIEAARQLAGSQVVVIGSGAAFAVAPLALRTSAPRASFVIDSGVVGARFQTAIRSVVDPAMPEALRLGSMSNVFLELLQAGRVDTSLLSADQPALELAALMPGVSLEEVQDHTGFALQIPTSIPRIAPPEPDVLRILRQDIDPTKLYL